MSLRTGQSKLGQNMAHSFASGHIPFYAWTAQSVNYHIALKAMFYLVIKTNGRALMLKIVNLKSYE